ncbi:hypothetical protein K1T71_012840 [Dendrolimus kikuchii]|uniref:Uncharacterized protein n=1 Tax=Dendrolimus kikuchii TaxID=765133 RepID=A0ACC1CI72_9NEOP|nr:hypothetical protein K1T71_012840 [Dendrolimus kikuchii]
MLAAFPRWMATLMHEETKSEEPLSWPKKLHLRGEVIDLSLAIVNDFEYWLDGRLGHSRIDYHNGTYKTYYYIGGAMRFPRMYHVIPILKDDKVEFICLRASSRRDQLLPSLIGYEKVGYKKHGNKSIEIWQRLVEDHPRRTEETILYVKTYSEKEQKFVAEPFQHIKKVLNVQKGRTEIYRITNYYNMELDFQNNKLEIENDDTVTIQCQNSNKASEIFKNVEIPNKNSQLHLDLLFNSYTEHHSKNYEEEERETRKQIFHKNLRLVNEHNKKNLSYRLELNAFSDWTDEELAYLSGTYPSDPEEVLALPFPHTEEEVENLVKELPSEYDLRLEGLISPVKNQAHCGSCWAFAATAVLEGALALKNGGRDLDLSEQSIVDCAWDYGNRGCRGGKMDKAFKYVMDKGIPTDREYGSYLGMEGVCHISNTSKQYQISGFARITPRNINAITHLALILPISDENHRKNHAITVVGYGERDGDLYWIVKNSWGETWGEDGYILLSANDNNCYLTDEAYFVVP